MKRLLATGLLAAVLWGLAACQGAWAEDGVVLSGTLLTTDAASR